MPTFNEALYLLQEQDIYVCCEPEVLDFTNSKKPAKLIVFSKTLSIEIKLDIEDVKLKELLSKLQLFIGNKNSIIISWGWKNFLSYAKGRTELDFVVDGNILELSCLESYAGIHAEKPKSFSEAKQRINNLIQKNRWSQIYKIYETVFLPLIYALPQIETCGLLNKEKKSKVYPYYVIDGQINGRMKATQAFQCSYNPHTFSIEERKKMQPICWQGEQEFLVFDYKHMEVSVLQWLTQDTFMGEILNSGKDFYECCWNYLFPTVPCNEYHRRTCKDFFLPVVYGLGSESLSQKISWPLIQCNRLIEKIYDYFSTAMGWIKQQQNNLQNNMAYDVFGRCRAFDSSYKVRNFCVQSPSSIICLHKLTELVKKIKNAKVCMHIHDGYVIICKKSDVEKIYETVKDVLESEHELYTGLKLRTTCSRGANLGELKKI